MSLTIKLRFIKHQRHQIPIIFPVSTVSWDKLGFLGVPPRGRLEDFDRILRVVAGRYLWNGPLVDAPVDGRGVVVDAQLYQRVRVDFDVAVDFHRFAGFSAEDRVARGTAVDISLAISGRFLSRWVE